MAIHSEYPHEHQVGPSDEQLVALCRGGDRDAFGVVVSRYQSLICALTYAGCGDVHRSEDVAQETFLQAWKHLGDLKEAGRLRSWLCGIARNLTAGEQRRRARAAAGGGGRDGIGGGAFDGSAVSTELAPPEEASRREEGALLWGALERLPAEYREPLVLFYRHEESVAAVAEALELSEDAARQRLSRGRAMLAKRLEHIVHRGLRTTGPTKVFTLAVLAALPGAVVVAATAATFSATAATIATADATAKGAAAKAVAAAGWTAWLGLFVSAFAGIFGAFYGYKVATASTATDTQRRFVRRAYWGLVAWAGGFSVLLFGVLVWADEFRPTNPMFGLPIAGLFLLYVAWIALRVVRYQRLRRGMQTAAFARDPQALAKVQEFCSRWNAENKEYKSRWTFLGLPLIHVNWTKSPDGRYSVAKGWIAMGGVAYGVLFAFGGVAVGAISCGGVAVGLLAVGGLAMGALPWGAVGVGIWAMGLVAIGWKASGLCALAWHSAAASVLAIAGEYAWGIRAVAKVTKSAAAEFFNNDSFFQFGRALVSSKYIYLYPAILVAMMMLELARLKRVKAKLTRVE
ncbi:MAG: sigma-70 family RNA polymerase sigma factor [Phycisphaerae bacterium]|nr:sigma-70 family RNA polymerase sigma factor [Phycisphaerae bacterium]